MIERRCKPGITDEGSRTGFSGHPSARADFGAITHQPAARSAGCDAVLVSDSLQVKVSRQGARILEVLHKPTGWSVIGGDTAFLCRAAEYDGNFEAGEISGFDEMFPTISACTYGLPPWEGVRLPDHGEVWSRDWDTRMEGSLLRQSISGVRLPYHLTRTIWLEGSELRMEYAAANPTEYDMEYIWAAHPLFNASADSEIVLPEGTDRVVCSVPGIRLQTYGGVYDWPLADTGSDGRVDLSRFRGSGAGGSDKFYVHGRLEKGAAAIVDRRACVVTSLRWSPEELPCLGIWTNEGDLRGRSQIALEPCSAPMDRVDAARNHGAPSVLPGRRTVTWSLTLRVDALRE